MNLRKLNDRFSFLERLGYWWKVIRGKELYYSIQSKKNTYRAGNIHAAWTVCPDHLQHDSVVLSFGAGKDISWELELIKKFGCRIFLFDPTPASIEWIAGQSLPGNLIFYPYGISDCNGKEKFYLPEEDGFVSASIMRQKDGKRFFEGTVYTLEKILQITGIAKAQILKMDIEGAEYKVIRSLQDISFRPEQILIEFHHRFSGIALSDTHNAIKTLNEMGYKIFSISPNGEEYSFIRE